MSGYDPDECSICGPSCRDPRQHLRARPSAGSRAEALVALTPRRRGQVR